MRIFAGVVGFEWDDGNKDKNLTKHGVTIGECEEVFQDEKAQKFPDFLHSQHEERNAILGVTKQGKLLRVSFTVRRNRIRIISARPVNRKERKLYD